jgi:hypothetical protein
MMSISESESMIEDYMTENIGSLDPRQIILAPLSLIASFCSIREGLACSRSRRLAPLTGHLSFSAVFRLLLRHENDTSGYYPALLLQRSASSLRPARLKSSEKRGSS